MTNVSLCSPRSQFNTKTNIASWDSPPRPGDPEYSSFEYAFKRFLFSREVHVPKMNKKEAQAFDKRPKGEYKSKYLLEGTPDLGQSDKLALMPFQVHFSLTLADR